jgi:hypothetical protein
MHSAARSLGARELAPADFLPVGQTVGVRGGAIFRNGLKVIWAVQSRPQKLSA